MTGSFYEPDGDAFLPQSHTRGPWDPRAQHAGPPAALLGRALETCEFRDAFAIARVTIEILRPVPLEPLEVRALVERSGRSVELLAATMRLADGTELMRAHAWRIRAIDTSDIATMHDDRPPPPPEQGTEPPFFRTPQEFGYGHAMEWRFVRGAFQEPGPATAWLRMRYPLVPGEDPSPLQRVLIAADSGNGISAALDPQKHYFINTDLTVNLHRRPAGEWIGLEAETRIDRGGIGLTETVLWDARGHIGRATQTLLAGPRG